jgi:hypothetical protein
VQFMAPSMIWTFFVDLNSSPPGGDLPGSITVGPVVTWDEHMGRSVAPSGQLLRRLVDGHHIATQDVSTVNEPDSQDTGPSPPRCGPSPGKLQRDSREKAS